ncbi:hypothetical protein CLOP_g16932 [Closterium sp. NIES-67]|nr:hypothetical protein CLOP_g16932 [Closterium sp. NIES-67]
MEDEADSPLLRFLIELLKPISEADPALLANYVVALLKNSKPHDELRQLCLDQLQDFLTDETEGFVTKLFDALERGEISLEDAEAEGDEPGGADDTDKKKSRGEDAEPAEANEGGRDGGRGGGKSGGRRGDGGQRGADEEGGRGRGAKRSGASRERGGRERADEDKERDDDGSKGGERGEREPHPAAEAEAEERAEAGGRSGRRRRKGGGNGTRRMSRATTTTTATTSTAAGAGGSARSATTARRGKEGAAGIPRKGAVACTRG